MRYWCLGGNICDLGQDIYVMQGRGSVRLTRIYVRIFSFDTEVQYENMMFRSDELVDWLMRELSEAPFYMLYRIGWLVELSG